MDHESSHARRARARIARIALTLSLAVSLAPAVARPNGGVVLTFDDTYIEDWHGIAPLLEQLGVRATFFVTRYHSLDATQRQLVRELIAGGHEIAAHAYDHANAATYCPSGSTGCSITDEERASVYIDEQILPQLGAMASDGIHPRSFAYPFGADFPATTERLLSYYDWVRDTSYYPHHDASYVDCESDRFIAGLGIDHAYGLSDSQYADALEQAVALDQNLVWYGHAIENQGSEYYVGPSRLEDLIRHAQSRGLRFRRLRDLCSWVTLGETGPPLDVHASSRPPSELRFGDFDGDGIADAFRTNGQTWQVLSGQGNGFYTGDGSESWQHLNTSGYELDQLRLGDFDGDGTTDVFRTTGGVWYVSFSGTGTWTQVESSGHPLEQLRFHDMNGNGTTDVFTVNGTQWLFSEGARADWTYLSSDGLAIESLRFADFDADGATDVFKSEDGVWSVRFGGTGDWVALNASGYGVEHLALADLHGDGRADVLRADGSTWYVSHDGTSAWSPLADSSKTLSDAAFVDIDGDAGVEILVAEDPLAVPEPGLSTGLALGLVCSLARGLLRRHAFRRGAKVGAWPVQEADSSVVATSHAQPDEQQKTRRKGRPDSWLGDHLDRGLARG